jgi:hypothetical protein
MVMPAITATTSNKNTLIMKLVISERLTNAILISFSNSQDIMKLTINTIPDLNKQAEKLISWYG